MPIVCMHSETTLFKSIPIHMLRHFVSAYYVPGLGEVLGSGQAKVKQSLMLTMLTFLGNVCLKERRCSVA